jgi:hypothetical protein
MKGIASLLAAVLLLIAATTAAAQPEVVSGSLKKLNGFVRIAVEPAAGNLLVVWSQGDTKNNDYGRIYAAYLERRQDGSYLAGEPFLFSTNKGSNQRPSVAWLPTVSLFIVAWDTSYWDPNEYMKFDHMADRPFAGTQVLARAWNPATAELGQIVTVNQADWELSIGADVVPIDVGAVAGPGEASERVFINFLSSDEERNGIAGPFEPGMWGSLWRVSMNGMSPSQPAGGGVITLIERKGMLTWAVPYGVATTVSGFVSGGKVYAAGAYMKFNFPMGNFYASGVGGIYRIDPVALTVEKFLATGELDLGPGKAFPINLFGEATPLPGAPAAPNGGFGMVGLSNIDKRVMTVGSDLEAGGIAYHGTASKTANEIVDQRLFMIGAVGAPAGETLYVLYHDKKGRFRYRTLTSSGQPKGVSKTVLKIKKNRLKYMSVAAFGNDALLAYSEQRNKKNWQIKFFRFTVK